MTPIRTCRKCQTTYPETSEFFGHTPVGNFRGTCRACMRQVVLKHTASNPALAKDRFAKRRLLQREQATPLTLSSQRISIKEACSKKQKGLCYYCKDRINGNGELDHMTPIAKGGCDDYTNQVLACSRCNKEKHNKTVAEYRIWLTKVGRSINF